MARKEILMRGRMMACVTIAGALAAFAGSAAAVDDVITFDELPVGTQIHGRTLYGYATFLTQVQAFDSPTVEVDGTPDDGAFGEGAFLIGTFGDFITIEMAVPVTRVAVSFTIDDTIHSSVQMHLQGAFVDGPGGVFEQGFPIASGTWPAIQSDSASGFVEIVSETPMDNIGMSFAAGVFATSFALDNIEITTVACARADVEAPYGVLDFSDVVRFLSAFGAGEPVADIALPFGTLDFTDVVEFVTSFGNGCG